MEEATFGLADWHPHYDVWIVMGALAIGYAVALKTWGATNQVAGRPATRAEAPHVFKATTQPIPIPPSTSQTS